MSIKNISIPETCRQQWPQMQSVEGGRHCEQCCKTVIDFTAMSNDDILTFLATKNNLCGRFGQEQLNRLNYLLRQNRSSIFSLKKFSWAAAVFAMAPFIKIQAQVPVRIEQTPFTKKTTGVAANTRYRTVSGIIIGADDKLPIVGAMVYLKGSNIGATTDIDGQFKINVPVGPDTLVCRFIGYEQREISLDKYNLAPINIKVKVEAVELTPVWTGGIVVGRSIFWRIWYDIKKPFTAVFERRNY